MSKFSKTVLLFGAGADIDAVDSAVAGDRLLLHTFRELDSVKSSEAYRNAFQRYFDSSPKLPYIWQNSVKSMISRALKAKSFEVLQDVADNVSLNTGDTELPIARQFFELLENNKPAKREARFLLFHMIAAVYGSSAVKHLQMNAADDLRSGLAQKDIHLPDQVYNELEIGVYHDPEKALVRAATDAINRSLHAGQSTADIDLLLTRLLDYRAVFDKVFHDLTTNKDQLAAGGRDTAAIKRAVHFMFALQRAVQNMNGQADANCYYNRIPDGVAAFTMNYTSILQNAMAANANGPTPVYLHGQSGETFDLQTGELNPATGGLPFLLPQTSSKPIASVETVRRFARFLDALDHCESLITVGYGFKSDDDHVTNMIFDAMTHNSKLNLICLALENLDTIPGIARLRERDPGRVETIRLNGDTHENRERFSEVLRSTGRTG